MTKDEIIKILFLHPEDFMDFAWSFVLIVFFAAFTKNVQQTTLDIGRRLFGAQTSPTGVQDAVTPTWQTRNNIIMFVLLFLLFIMCVVLFVEWYIGLGVFLLTFFVVIPLVSRFLMFPPGSVFIVKKIRNNLLKRRQQYEEAGDSARVEAISLVLERLDEITDLE